MIVRFLIAGILSGIPTIVYGQTFLGSKYRTVQAIDMRDSLLAAATDSGIEIWNLNSEKLISTLSTGSEKVPSAITFGRDTHEVLLGTRAGMITYYTSEGSKVILQQENDAVTSLAISQSTGLVVAGFSSGAVKGVSLTEQHPEFSLTYSSDVTDIKFWQSDLVFIGLGDGRVIQYNTTSKEEKPILDMERWIHAIAVNTKSNKFAVADRTTIQHADLTKSGYTTFQAGALVWISALDIESENTLAYATLSGKVFIRTKFGDYSEKLRASVIQVRFMSRPDQSLRLVVATRDKGLLILHARDMKFKKP